MPYQHIDIESHQAPKRVGAPCGDTFLAKRTVYHTTLIVADGIGSGIRAHVASQMNASRLAELLAGGASLREAFLSVAGTMSQWRDHAMPFAAFIVARILNDGMTSILGYEMPPPVLIGPGNVQVLKAEPLIVPAGVASEYRCRLEPGEGLLLMSDGIVQAGLGKSLLQGWSVQGVGEFITDSAGERPDFRQIAREVMRQAQEHDGAVSGDDKTVALAHSRLGQVVHLLTGPASDKVRDAEVVSGFLREDGLKVICGATTAEVVARHWGRELEVEQRPASLSTPPRYLMDGIDLVTEGAVTLNQVYNILEEDLRKNYDRSAAADLAWMLQDADFVRFTVGCAANPANLDIVYRKQGIFNRDKIIPLIADKLERMGKLVTVEYC